MPDLYERECPHVPSKSNVNVKYLTEADPINLKELGCWSKA